MTTPSLGRRCLGELIGTFLLVFFGCGVVHAAVLAGAQSGLWQVAVVWGLAITMAIYVVGGLSGAHLNPAMTLAFSLWRGFPPALVLPYVLAQLAGAMCGAAVVFALFHPLLEQREAALGIERGQAGSELTAMCFGEYYPNPGRLEEGWRQNSDPQVRAALRQDHARLVPESSAFLAELLGTMVLALVVFAVTDERNPRVPGANSAPVFIGLTVAILISVLAPLTQAGFNPARDFGPRLFSFFAGWGEVAIPGPNGRGFFTVYILAPLLGGVLGGGLYQLMIGPKEEKTL